MSASLHAAAPSNNATVMASAGTGKTWLLVTRLVRLLLAGSPADGILAVTFTRKAAAEILTRLNQRLLSYVHLSEHQLDQALAELGATANAETRARARRLYEELLFSEHPIRATTFHAFCQDTLQRFPLEASVPPGFELLDTAGLLQNEAWDALYSEATADQDGTTARALETLFDQCRGLHNTHAALSAFLHHRSDWWAFTEGQADALAYAEQSLLQILDIDPSADPGAAFLAAMSGDVSNFAELLQRHATASNLGHADLLTQALDTHLDDEQRLALLRQVFFTGGGTQRVRKASKAQEKNMGAEAQQLFLSLHNTLCERLEQVFDQRRRRHTWQLSCAWFRAGTRLLEHYQRIKREQRWLDFDDLEWKTYELLHNADNAHWIQYKLDQRIDHFLVDEFQDTNPTQWRLLLPLLQELAAGDNERQRSVFLVGDVKQSIYRFRRAEPRLMDSAADWLGQHLDAKSYSLDYSWRSSPAVIDCINAVFGSGELNEYLPNFKPHDTHRRAFWGQVDVLPLSAPPPMEATADTQAPTELRNPLHAARIVEEDARHFEEGRSIAARIGGMIRQPLPIVDGDGYRAVQYSDIYILLRKRTHAHAIERALREANIPYLGAERGTLLNSLEIQDMEALLTILVMPYNNLALAQVLRSPVFAVSDEDLIRLAADGGGAYWYERLAQFTNTTGPTAALARAQRLLGRWSRWAGQIPVHDLLDRIYSEGNVLRRYEAAFPEGLRARARSNLTRFLELALEVDSGRYPSLAHFIHRLQELRRHRLEAPDAPPAGSTDDRVRILTIHASKGLEAPVVFLADTTASTARNEALRTVVQWPANSERPTSFYLAPKSAQRDTISTRMLQHDDDAGRREEANLLYVALSRARQYLIISGSEPARGKDLGWYGKIRSQLETIAQPDGPILTLRSPIQPPEWCATDVAVPAVSHAGLDARLRQPLPATLNRRREIAPSRSTSMEDATALPGEDGRQRGLGIHRLLEWLSATPAPKRDDALRALARELALNNDDERLQSWWDEAWQVVHDPALASVFGSTAECAYNEVAIQYYAGQDLVHGVIDRVVVNPTRILVVDYKTHAGAQPANLDQLAGNYIEQLRWYAQGAARLWPERVIETVLLFTACRRLHSVALE